MRLLLLVRVRMLEDRDTNHVMYTEKRDIMCRC